MTHLSEQFAASTSAEIYVDVVVFTANRFLNKGFFQNLISNYYGITIFSKSNFWADDNTTKFKSQLLVHDRFDVIIDLWSSVSRNFQSSRHGDSEAIEDHAYKTTIPQ